MPTTSLHHPSLIAALARQPSLKRTHSDMNKPRRSTKWIDDEYYTRAVLCLPADVTESDVDRRLLQHAKDLGVTTLHIVTNVQRITASLSGTTIASEPTTQASIISNSTAPTSCSSSEHYLTKSPTPRAETVPVSPVVPDTVVDAERKRKAGFRNGIRKMAAFSRKRKSRLPSSPSLMDHANVSYSEVDGSQSPEDTTVGAFRRASDADSLDSHSRHLPLKSPSIRSSKSSDVWSAKLSATTKSSYDQGESLVDHEALQRSIDNVEFAGLRMRQAEERQRFLSYQSQTMDKIRSEKEAIKAQRRESHTRVVAEQMVKNDIAIEDLESRQLEEELKLTAEHENEKRSILARLRHMEAYCQTPSPPPTPMETSFPASGRNSPHSSTARGSTGSANSVDVLPERRVTDRDYHNLASCYRERDAMDNLHMSKINVLRGKQKRAVENFALKKEQDIERLYAQNAKELDAIDLDWGIQEAECRAEFWDKRQLLEGRWKLQAMIERARAERRTGLKHELLPTASLTEHDAFHGLGIAQ